MNTTLHVIRKDLRYVRWPLVLWLVLLAAPTLALAFGLDTRADAALFYLVALVSWVLAVRLVHSDPLDDSSAFWLTRPLDPGALLAAKLALVFGVLLALQVVAASLAAAANGVLGVNLLRFAAEVALLQAIFLVAIVLLATLTRDPARLVLSAIVASIAWLALHVMLTVTTETGGAASALGRVPLSGLLVGAIAACIGGLLLIRHQYRTRRTARSATLAVLLAVGVLLLADLWPTNLFAVPGPIDARVFDPRSVAVSVSDIAAGRGGVGSRAKYLFGHFAATGVRPGWAVAPLRVSGRLTLADGATVTSTVGDSGDRQGLPSPGIMAAVGHAANGRWLNDPFAGPRDSRALVLAGKFPGDQLRKFLGKTADYSAVVTLGAFRAQVSASAPLRPGARLRVGSTEDAIIAIRRIPGGGRYGPGHDPWGEVVEVMMRSTRPQSLFARGQPETAYVLRNASRGEIVFGVGGLVSLAWGLPAPVYLQVRHTAIRFGGSPASGLELGDDWLSHAELLAVTLEEKGTFTKSIRVPALVLTETP